MKILTLHLIERNHIETTDLNKRYNIGLFEQICSGTSSHRLVNVNI